MSNKNFFVTIVICLIILLLSVGCTDNRRQGTENSRVLHDNIVEVPPAVPDNIPAATTAEPKESLTSGSDDIIRKLFNNKQSDVQVQGSGTVTQILSDDNTGVRHQRFLLKLDSGQTLLIAHNIDLAPRLEGVSPGTKVAFYGEYYYNDQGGGIHWTHQDPKGNHVQGYLKVLSQPLPVPRPVMESKNYIGNKNSLVLHTPTCNSLPAERNRIYFGTIDEALKQGYHKHSECMGK